LLEKKSYLIEEIVHLIEIGSYLFIKGGQPAIFNAWMRRPFYHTPGASYWLKVFALYALAEACIQLLFLVVLNNFGNRRISIIEFHGVMWVFQCVLICPIWWVASAVKNKSLLIQVIVNLGFYIIYSYCWFGPVQEWIGFLYNNLQQITRPPGDRQVALLDNGSEYSYLNYQLIKHAFRLSWFYLAAYFYNYQLEENKRIELAVANKDLQLKMLKWHLNPSFYFNTIEYLKKLAAIKPAHATEPILQLAKVMEYVIYETKEKLINVKKEILFLQNYIYLKNQQVENNTKIEIEVTGEYEKLKIAPLLLAVFVDKLALNEQCNGSPLYKMKLEFTGSVLQLSIMGTASHTNAVLLWADESLLLRLQELYLERYFISGGAEEQPAKLSIQLDAEN
jgi:Histidine kinase